MNALSRYRECVAKMTDFSYRGVLRATTKANRKAPFASALAAHTQVCVTLAR